MRPPRVRPPSAEESAAIDARYGLEPVLEPGEAVAGLAEFVSVACPYCGERYATSIDLTGGSFCYVEDCEICCQPIELAVEVGDTGALERWSTRRLD